MKVIFAVPIWISLVSCLFGMSFSVTTPCNLRRAKYGFVCVCTDKNCDYLENPKPAGEKDFVIVSSTELGLRFSTAHGHFGNKEKLIVKDYKEMLETDWHNVNAKMQRDFDPQSIVIDNEKAFIRFNFSEYYINAMNASQKPIYLTVDRSKQYQQVTGFGGAFTGAVSHILSQLSPSLQDHVYKSFFHKDGIGFNIVRIPIGASDFDLEPWAYNQKPVNDAQLTNFTKLDYRDEKKVEQMKRMKRVAELEEIKIMAAAWSSPTWMKSNDDWSGFNYLKPEYYQTWADYHLKFIEIMDTNNMPIWAISTGNEPLNAVIGWFYVRFISLGWTPSNQAIWLCDHLGPTIRNSKYKDVLIFSNDDQRYTYPAWFKKMKLMRSQSLDYLDGLAVHWYWDEAFAPVLIDAAHKEMPGKLLINTESSIGDKPWQFRGPELGAWDRAENYMRAFLQDFQHAFNGWIDWNIVLDEQGGPNYVKNYVDAPVIVNTTNNIEFYKQPIFYAIGHFSKFIPEGSVRICAEMSNPKIDSVAFLRPDNTVVLIIYNGGYTSVDVSLSDSARGNIMINLPVHSFHTVIYN